MTMQQDKKNIKTMLAEFRVNHVTEYKKSQLIRLADVVFIGPAMMYAGTFKELPAWLRYSMLFTGFCTIVYNGRNFLINYQRDLAEANLKTTQLKVAEIIKDVAKKVENETDESVAEQLIQNATESIKNIVVEKKDLEEERQPRQMSITEKILLIPVEAQEPVAVG